MYRSSNGQNVEIKRNPKEKTLSINFYNTNGEIVNSDSGNILLNKDLQLTFTGKGVRQNGQIIFDGGQIWTKLDNDRIQKNLCKSHRSVVYVVLYFIHTINQISQKAVKSFLSGLIITIIVRFRIRLSMVTVNSSTGSVVREARTSPTRASI